MNQMEKDHFTETVTLKKLRDSLKNTVRKTHGIKVTNVIKKISSVMFVETFNDTLLKMLKATEDKYAVADNKWIKFVS